MNIYFISGLGIDKRVFQKLQLPTGFSPHYIEWIQPLPHEPIDHYAQRLSSFINTSQPFVLVGMSFGGMMSVEVNRFVHPVKTIIISSAATRYELPPYFQLIRRLHIHKIVPTRFLKNPNVFTEWLFGIQTDEEKKLFKEVLHDADPRIVKWSINAVLNWQNTKVPAHLVRLHGTDDNLLVPKWANADIWIKGGKHFMVFSKADEVSNILAQLLNETPYR